MATDQNGSPLAFFDTNGNMIKEVRRSPFGHLMVDTNPDLVVLVGYQGGIPDPHTGFLYLRKRWYDPQFGQWITPDWERLANELTAPTDIFIYRFQNNDPINPLERQSVNYMTGKRFSFLLGCIILHCWRILIILVFFSLDLGSWLKLYGYDMDNILGSSYTRRMVYQPMAKVASPQLSPDFGVMSGLQCIIEKVIVLLYLSISKWKFSNCANFRF